MSFILFQSTAAPNALLQFLPIILIFGIFYFLLFMPMQKQKKKQQQMLASLKSGDEVITTGGIVGTITSVNDDDTIVVRVKPGDVKLQMIRGAVASLKEAEKKS
ncbi:MAG: preprotein translocase subunit YajC [Acidobacteria bacterium]|nr:preprotein translocase subunit YajC [Acidobacteriota bacterium]